MVKGKTFNGRIATAVFTALFIIAGFILVIFHFNFFLLVFASIFFAVLLNYASSWFTIKLKLKYGLSLLLVLLIIVAFFTGIIMLLGPSMVDQVNKMMDTLPQSFANFKERVSQTPLGQEIFSEIPDNPLQLIEDKRAAFNRVIGSFSSTIGTIANLVIVIVTGIFLASNPKVYKNGFVSLFPVSFRPRLVEVMNTAQDTLSLWMMAKLISMLVVGISTAIGLQLLGIPLAYALALIAALFSFIPNIGPYLALAPAVLIALMQGWNEALYVLILYFSIQIVESYLITPMIEKKMVHLPPALTLIWMLFFGIIAGILGLILATPILAAIIVIVGELYVKDYLQKGKENVEGTKIDEGGKKRGKKI